MYSLLASLGSSSFLHLEQGQIRLPGLIGCLVDITWSDWLPRWDSPTPWVWQQQRYPTEPRRMVAGWKWSSSTIGTNQPVVVEWKCLCKIVRVIQYTYSRIQWFCTFQDFLNWTHWCGSGILYVQYYKTFANLARGKVLIFNKSQGPHKLIIFGKLVNTFL